VATAGLAIDATELQQLHTSPPCMLQWCHQEEEEEEKEEEEKEEEEGHSRD
jgi:hypothetical protein